MGFVTNNKRFVSNLEFFDQSINKDNGYNLLCQLTDRDEYQLI